MSRNRRSERQAAYEKRIAVKSERQHGVYVYGSTVRVTEAERQWEAEPKKRMQPAVRRNREKAHHMSAGYVIFLVTALCAAAFTLVNYIQLQAQLTNLTKSIAAKKSELNALRDANDEAYNRIVNNIDLEEIKRIAIGELGMTYAGEGQIILYTGECEDYMWRVPGAD